MLSRRPQFAVLSSNRGVEAVVERLREIVGADQRQDVGEILQAVGRRDPGCQLQLDERRQVEDAPRSFCPLDGRRARLGSAQCV